MDKITKKLIKYFLLLITSVVLLCFIFSSIFLSQFYIAQQYRRLEGQAQQIYTSLQKNTPYSDSTVTAFLIKGDSVQNLNQGRSGMMGFFRNINYGSLLSKGSLVNGMGEKFLFYKLSTELGDIVVLQSSNSASEYLRVVYIILLLVFLLALLLSVPFVSYIGKKFTEPILKLKKSSIELAKGNFDIDLTINTKDEMGELSQSLQSMALELKKKYTLQREFIANVSHDFKTPLSIIRNYSEALKDGILEVEDTAAYAEDIIGEVDRLNNLVMHLLQLSKLQGGNVTLNTEWISVPQLLQQWADTFSSISQTKHIELHVSSVEVQILADATALSRVLYNFIDNAIKFSPENSNIEISCCQIDSEIRISVKDYGSGIEESMLSDIWNRYYKHNISGGMGLGLAICSEILNHHNFKYGVESSMGKGTEFFFLIPAACHTVK